MRSISIDPIPVQTVLGAGVRIRPTNDLQASFEFAAEKLMASNPAASAKKYPELFHWKTVVDAERRNCHSVGDIVVVPGAPLMLLKHLNVPSHVSEIVLEHNAIVAENQQQLMQITVYRDDPPYPPYYVAEWEADPSFYRVLFTTMRLLHEELAARFDFPLVELTYTVRVSPERENVFSDLHQTDIKDLAQFLLRVQRQRRRVARIDGAFFGISQEGSDHSIACFTSPYKLPDSLVVVWSASKRHLGTEASQQYVMDAIQDFGIDWNWEAHKRLYGTLL